MKIPALQAVTVEILVDNFFDVFEPSRPGIVERVIPGRLKKPLVAAHGLAYLITLNHQGKLSRILMDAANAPVPCSTTWKRWNMTSTRLTRWSSATATRTTTGGCSILWQRPAAPFWFIS